MDTRDGGALHKLNVPPPPPPELQMPNFRVSCESDGANSSSSIDPHEPRPLESESAKNPCRRGIQMRSQGGSGPRRMICKDSAGGGTFNAKLSRLGGGTSRTTAEAAAAVVVRASGVFKRDRRQLVPEHGRGFGIIFLFKASSRDYRIANFSAPHTHSR